VSLSLHDRRGKFVGVADIAFTFSALSSYLGEIVSNSEGNDLLIFIHEADGDLIAVSAGNEFTQTVSVDGSLSQVSGGVRAER